jgi:hypothetical protein
LERSNNAQTDARQTDVGELMTTIRRLLSTFDSYTLWALNPQPPLAPRR